MAPMRCNHQRRILPQKSELDGDYDYPKTLIITNENVWCRHRKFWNSLAMTYQRRANAGSDEFCANAGFYAMLDVNRCLCLTSGTHAEKFASSGTYF